MSEKEKNNILSQKEIEFTVIKFLKKGVRRTKYNNEHWFSLVDIIDALVDTENPNRYWSDLKTKMQKDENFQLYDFIVRLKIQSADCKFYETDCTKVEGILRIIQSVPSKNAESFKRWLAKVGFERLEEHNNPDLTKN